VRMRVCRCGGGLGLNGILSRHGLVIASGEVLLVKERTQKERNVTLDGGKESLPPYGSERWGEEEGGWGGREPSCE
jgi:hypothetical protein